MPSAVLGKQSRWPHRAYVLSFFLFGCAGSSLLHGLSLVAENGGYFCCSVWALITVASPVTELRL